MAIEVLAEFWAIFSQPLCPAIRAGVGARVLEVRFTHSSGKVCVYLPLLELVQFVRLAILVKQGLENGKFF